MKTVNQQWESYRKQAQAWAQKPLNTRTPLAECLERLRLQFALASAYEQECQKGLSIIKQMLTIHPNAPELQMYALAFRAVDAKYKIFPLEKWNIINDVLPKMDALLLQNKHSIVVRFLRGAVCSGLPTLFNRAQTAKDDFNFILFAFAQKNLPTELENLPDLAIYILNFMESTKLLTNDKKVIIQRHKEKIEQNHILNSA